MTMTWPQVFFFLFYPSILSSQSFFFPSRVRLVGQQARPQLRQLPKLFLFDQDILLTRRRANGDHHMW